MGPRLAGLARQVANSCGTVASEQSARCAKLRTVLGHALHRSVAEWKALLLLKQCEY